jgi:hypothetical protein
MAEVVEPVNESPTREWAALVAFSVVLLFARGASAEEEPRGGWYGYQTLLADGVAAVLAGRAIQASRAGASGGALAGDATPTAAVYVLGAPSVHLIHGHPRRALADAGARAAIPAALGALGILVGGGVGLALAQANPQAERTPFAYALYGGIAGVGAGLLTSITLDAISAHDPPATPSPSANALPQIHPNVVLDPRSPSIGVRGNF